MVKLSLCYKDTMHVCKIKLKINFTVKGLRIPPQNATGDKIVGGIPACQPIGATKFL